MLFLAASACLPACLSVFSQLHGQYLKAGPGLLEQAASEEQLKHKRRM